MATGKKNDFYESLSDYMKILDSADAKNIEHDLYNKLLESIEHKKATSVDVVQAFSRCFSEYSTRKISMLYLMRAVITTSEMINSYRYPEFFWIIIQSGLLSEIENINDIMTSLTDIGGYDVVRSYLTYTLLTCEEEKQLRIVQAFYYTGHTFDTIKMVAQLIPLKIINEQACIYLFSDAMSFLYSKRALSMNDDDKAYLKGLFEDGIELFTSSHIVESCEKGLSKLQSLLLE